MRQISADKATVGRTYKNARGTLVTITEIPPEPGQVRVTLPSGTSSSIPRAYPLEIIDAGPLPKDVALGPVEQIRAAVAEWTVEDLEDLSDLDQRREVQDLIRVEIGKRTHPTEEVRPHFQPGPGPEQAPAATVICAVCSTPVAPMMSAPGAPARVGVHANPTTQVYCGGSACDPKAANAPAESLAEPEAAASVAPELSSADQLCALGGHALHTDGRTCVNCGKTVVVAQAAPMVAGVEVPKSAADRIKLIRTFTTPAQVEEARAWPGYQAPSLDPELKAQARLLAEVEAAQAGRNMAELQRLAGLKTTDIRPGVMAMIRRAIAVLQGEGQDVTPSARLAEAEDLEPVPLTVTPDDCPPSLAPTLAELVKVTTVRAWAGEVVRLIRDVLSSVRDGRAALQRTDDVATLRLAWRLELVSRRRTAILDQLRARVTALGGAEVTQEDVQEVAEVGVVAPTAAEVEQVTRPRIPGRFPHPDHPRKAVDPSGQLAESEGRKAFQDGSAIEACPYDEPFWRDPWEHGWRMARMDAERAEVEAEGTQAFRAGWLIDGCPYQDEFYRDAWESGWLAAARVDSPPPGGKAAPPPAVSERIGDLPLPDQVAKATTARALELIPLLQTQEDVLRAKDLEQARPQGERRQVVQYLEARWVEVSTEAALPPATQLPAPVEVAQPPPLPPAPKLDRAPAPRAFQVQDLKVHALPDGSKDLWAYVFGHHPALVGRIGDPAIAQVVELYERHLLEKTQEQAPTPKPADPADPALSAQAALAAFAAALPALSAMGLDVTLTITTRRP